MKNFAQIAGRVRVTSIEWYLLRSRYRGLIASCITFAGMKVIVTKVQEKCKVDSDSTKSLWLKTTQLPFGLKN